MISSNLNVLFSVTVALTFSLCVVYFYTENINRSLQHETIKIGSSSPQQQQQETTIQIAAAAAVTDNNPLLVTRSTNSTTDKVTFAHRVNDFPWDNLLLDDKDIAKTYWVRLFNYAFQTNIMEPFVPINSTCKAPTLSTKPDCNEVGLFTGKYYTQPVKVAHAVQFGFDADVFEIHLNEIYDVVDKIFIIESTMFHNGGVGSAKPLGWDAIKRQDRFIKFEDKIVHFILDAVDEEKVRHHPHFASDIFTPENYQEYVRWQKILEWNEITGFFSDDDIIGLGDADEITARANINRLKWCELEPTFQAVDIGLWFYRGFLDMAFASDWPVQKEPFTLGDPTFRTFKTAKDFRVDYDTLTFPSRERGRSMLSMIGGIHMTQYGTLAFTLSKHLSCTECIIGSAEMTALALKLKNASISNTWAELEDELHNQHVEESNRIKYLRNLPTSLRNAIEYYPWFYACNKERYPTFLGKPDSRTA